MISSTDQLGRLVELNEAPKRIISLVPSQTELLHDFGLKNEIIGITKFCVHPDHWREQKTVIGGTKNFKVDLIKSLNPDLVIANKEENTEEGIREISDFCPVWISDVQDIVSALGMIKGIGQIVSRQEDAEKLIIRIREGFDGLNRGGTKRAIYLIWKNPFMATGSDTFIHNMMPYAGYENLIVEKRYPKISEEEIANMNPDVILLSSEPYPFKHKQLVELEKAMNCEVKLVDGELFSWYGSRMLKAIDLFKKDGEAPAAPPV